MSPEKNWMKDGHYVSTHVLKHKDLQLNKLTVQQFIMGIPAEQNP